MFLKKVDATKGPLVKLIFIYTVPIILSTILQHLFEVADKAVLGNMAGSVAVAAVGASGIVTSLIISAAVGLSTGTSIILARYIGQNHEKRIRETVDTSLLTAVGLGLAVAVVGFFVAPPFLTATKCPADCYEGALLYIRMYFAAAPASLLYNYGSAILRTLGDTQRPLIYIIIAGIVNVVLNVILCILLSQKVAAVAIATAVSQIISAILVLWRLCHFEGVAKVTLSKIRFRLSAFGQILRFGIPASISQLVLPLGNLQIATAINSFGVEAIAGNSAANSVHMVLAAFPNGFAVAATTFMGQNIGTGDVGRVKKSFWYLFSISVSIAAVLGVLTCLSGRFWLGLIVGREATIAVDYGMSRLLHVVPFLFISGANGIFSHALQAFGYPLFTSITNIAFNLGFRVLWMQLVYPKNPTFDTIMLCFTVSWILNMLLCAVFFAFVYWRYTRKGICKKI